MFVGVLIASLLLLVHSQSTAVLGVELAGTGAVLAAGLSLIARHGRCLGCLLNARATPSRQRDG